MNSADRIRLGLIDNGLDFLLSAAEHAKAGSPRDLKYSVLHLFDGLELLLKARLEQEHWTLLFQDSKQMSRKMLEAGDFKSVDFNTVMERLENIAGVTLDNYSKKHLTAVRTLRNKVRHFIIDVSVIEVKAKLADTLNFAIHFLEDELEPTLNGRQLAVKSDILGHLTVFQEFVNQRISEFKNRLSPLIQFQECPNCFVEALHFWDGEPKCEYCMESIDAEDWASVLSEAGVFECPECLQETLALVLLNNEEAEWTCTKCGLRRDDTLSNCSRCGSTYFGENVMCENCWGAIVARG